ncbi:MAG: hypothetical protein ACK4PH_08640, partial [Aquincola tertiaricarbonis]
GGGTGWAAAVLAAQASSHGRRDCDNGGDMAGIVLQPHDVRCRELARAARLFQLRGPGGYAGAAAIRSNRRRPVATPNYSYEKRQRELAKKRKAEEKRQKKVGDRGSHEPAPNEGSADPAPAPGSEPPAR